MQEGIIDHDGVLKMTDGWLQGLSEVTRAGDIVLAYSNKILNVQMELGFDVLDVRLDGHLCVQLVAYSAYV